MKTNTIAKQLYKKEKLQALIGASKLTDIEKLIQDLISTACDNLELNINVKDIQIDQPENEKFGDYSANIALKLFANIKKNQQDKSQSLNYKSPLQLAESISKQLNTLIDAHSEIQKISAIAPGFINFSLSNSFLINELEKNLSIISNKVGDKLLKDDYFNQKKVMVEFTDPNPFKEFHIGHLYSNIVGESLSRLFNAVGATVKRVCYQGDVGMHVSKSVWGMISKMAQENTSLDKLSKLPLDQRIKFLGQSYAYGATKYKDDEAAQKEMKDINYLIYLSGQEYLQKTINWEPQVDYKQHVKDAKFDYQTIKTIYETGREWSLEYFETIYKKLGTKFDDYFFESLVGEIGAKIVYENLKKGIFVKSQGATIFPGKKHGLHDRVFINSFGLPTYEAKDLGLAVEKNNRWKYDISIPVTGSEIDDYFKVIMKALKQTKPELEAKNVHISHGMVRLPSGKMSSRTGKILTGVWLINEAKHLIEKIVHKSHPDWSKNKQSETSEIIGLAAIKYALLNSSLGKDIAFDFKQSLNFQGSSGPYLLYTYARCNSVLKKAKEAGINVDNKLSKDDLSVGTQEQDVLKKSYQFVNAINKSIKNLSPHHLCNYLYKLAQAYNLFYNKCPIVKCESKNQQQLRMQITKSTSLILKHGLYLLGIKVVEEM